MPNPITTLTPTQLDHMKETPLLGLIILLWLQLPIWAYGQSQIPFVGFEPPTFITGEIDSQSGWSSNDTGATTDALVTSSEAYTGNQSLLLSDDDSTLSSKAWYEPTGNNETAGQFDIAIGEDQNTAGRDYWTIIFSDTGSNSPNFRLGLSSATTLTLYGGPTGYVALASVDTTTTSYDPAAWNTFSIVFDESTNQGSVYLNGETSPILSSSDTSTDWILGRCILNAGWSTFTNIAVFFDEISTPTQTIIPLPNFEAPTYASGALDGQDGWTLQYLNAPSQALVSSNDSYLGSQSIFLRDDDSTRNPRAWREPTGSNYNSGSFDVALREDPSTTGRDYWSILFSDAGSTAPNFWLALSSSTSITLYGGTTGYSALATVDTSTTSYDPDTWNTLSVQFSEDNNAVAVYLNEESFPILTSTDTSTDWILGRYTLAAGWSTMTDIAVYYDDTDGSGILPEWETTEKLRYAPPTLVAPTVWETPVGYAAETFPEDEDAIVQLPINTVRTHNMAIYSGRNVRVIGGDLGSYYIAADGQTESIFIEGIKSDHALMLPIVNGVPVELYETKTAGSMEHDGLMVSGLSDSEPGQDVYIQNCSIKGVHGTAYRHSAAIEALSIVCTSITGDAYTVTLTLNESITMAQNDWIIVGATDNASLSGQYKYTSSTPTTGSVFTLSRADPFNPLPTGLYVGATGYGGYGWRNAVGGSLHADAFQTLANNYLGEYTMLNYAYFYRVSLSSNAECFLGLNQYDTQGMRGLVMTRVNMSVNDIWPQNYDSQSLYIGTTDQSSGGWGSEGMPVTLDRVYIKPRENRRLDAAVYPGAGTTRYGNNVSPFTTDGWESLEWPSIMEASGKVTLSTSPDGYPGESGFTDRDYADLTGTYAPGLNYVSPGYSSDSIEPLVMSDIIGSPALTSTIVIPSDAAAGTLVSRLDVEFSGRGHIINLDLTDASGQFEMDPDNKRNIVVASSLGLGTYQVTSTASEDGNSSNQITRQITIQVVAP